MVYQDFLVSKCVVIAVVEVGSVFLFDWTLPPVVTRGVEPSELNGKHIVSLTGVLT